MISKEINFNVYLYVIVITIVLLIGSSNAAAIGDNEGLSYKGLLQDIKQVYIKWWEDAGRSEQAGNLTVDQQKMVHQKTQLRDEQTQELINKLKNQSIRIPMKIQGQIDNLIQFESDQSVLKNSIIFTDAFSPAVIGLEINYNFNVHDSSQLRKDEMAIIEGKLKDVKVLCENGKIEVIALLEDAFSGAPPKYYFQETVNKTRRKDSQEKVIYGIDIKNNIIKEYPSSSLYSMQWFKDNSIDIVIDPQSIIVTAYDIFTTSFKTLHCTRFVQAMSQIGSKSYCFNGLYPFGIEPYLIYATKDAEIGVIIINDSSITIKKLRDINDNSFSESLFSQIFNNIINEIPANISEDNVFQTLVPLKVAQIIKPGNKEIKSFTKAFEQAVSRKCNSLITEINSEVTAKRYCKAYDLIKTLEFFDPEKSDSIEKQHVDHFSLFYNSLGMEMKLIPPVVNGINENHDNVEFQCESFYLLENYEINIDDYFLVTGRTPTQLNDIDGHINLKQELRQTPINDLLSGYELSKFFDCLSKIEDSKYSLTPDNLYAVHKITDSHIVDGSSMDIKEQLIKNRLQRCFSLIHGIQSGNYDTTLGHINNSSYWLSQMIHPKINKRPLRLYIGSRGQNVERESSEVRGRREEYLEADMLLERLSILHSTIDKYNSINEELLMIVEEYGIKTYVNEYPLSIQDSLQEWLEKRQALFQEVHILFDELKKEKLPSVAYFMEESTPKPWEIISEEQIDFDELEKEKLTAGIEFYEIKSTVQTGLDNILYSTSQNQISKNSFFEAAFKSVLQEIHVLKMDDVVEIYDSCFTFELFKNQSINNEIYTFVVGIIKEMNNSVYQQLKVNINELIINLCSRQNFTSSEIKTIPPFIEPFDSDNQMRIKLESTPSFVRGNIDNHGQSNEWLQVERWIKLAQRNSISLDLLNCKSLHFKTQVEKILSWPIAISIPSKQQKGLIVLKGFDDSGIYGNLYWEPYTIGNHNQYEDPQMRLIYQQDSDKEACLLKFSSKLSGEKVYNCDNPFDVHLVTNTEISSVAKLNKMNTQQESLTSTVSEELHIGWISSGSFVYDFPLTKNICNITGPGSQIYLPEFLFLCNANVTLKGRVENVSGRDLKALLYLSGEGGFSRSFVNGQINDQQRMKIVEGDFELPVPDRCVSVLFKRAQQKSDGLWVIDEKRKTDLELSMLQLEISYKVPNSQGSTLSDKANTFVNNYLNNSTFNVDGFSTAKRINDNIFQIGNRRRQKSKKFTLLDNYFVVSTMDSLRAFSYECSSPNREFLEANNLPGDLPAGVLYISDDEQCRIFFSDKNTTMIQESLPDDIEASSCAFIYDELGNTDNNSFSKYYTNDSIDVSLFTEDSDIRFTACSYLRNKNRTQIVANINTGSNNITKTFVKNSSSKKVIIDFIIPKGAQSISFHSPPSKPSGKNESVTLINPIVRKSSMAGLANDSSSERSSTSELTKDTSVLSSLN